MENETEKQEVTTADLFDDSPPAEPWPPPAIEAAPQLRTKLLAAIHTFAASLEQEPGQLPTLDDLMSKTDEEIGWLRSRCVDALRVALFGVKRPILPTVDIQLANFVSWQKSRGAAYFEWPAEAMEILRAKLAEFGEGIELLPAYAHSVMARLQNGRVIHINRKGEIINQ
jgi:hypothetical protein